MPLEAGQSFRLTVAIMGIEAFEGRMAAVIIPAGNTLRVVGFPCIHDIRMADALWGKRPVALFEQDLHARAKQITAAFASALTATAAA
jgi:hypothetical protein